MKSFNDLFNTIKTILITIGIGMACIFKLGEGLMHSAKPLTTAGEKMVQIGKGAEQLGQGVSEFGKVAKTAVKTTAKMGAEMAHTSHEVSFSSPMMNAARNAMYASRNYNPSEDNKISIDLFSQIPEDDLMSVQNSEGSIDSENKQRERLNPDTVKLITYIVDFKQNPFRINSLRNGLQNLGFSDSEITFVIDTVNENYSLCDYELLNLCLRTPLDLTTPALSERFDTKGNFIRIKTNEN